MAGLKRTLEGDIDIRVAGGDAFHDIFLSTPHQISNIKPELVQNCHLHDGAFGVQGSKIEWIYTLDGKNQRCKQILEVIDEENKKIVFKCIEGDLLDDYKTFVITYKVIPTGAETSTIKWIMEYEKKHKGIGEPTSLMDILLELAKDIDDHHHRQA